MYFTIHKYFKLYTTVSLDFKYNTQFYRKIIRFPFSWLWLLFSWKILLLPDYLSWFYFYQSVFHILKKSQMKIVVTSLLADWRISHFSPCTGYPTVSGPQQVSEGWMNKLRDVCWSLYPCQFCWLDHQSQYHPLICMMWFCDCNTDCIISI